MLDPTDLPNDLLPHGFVQRWICGLPVDGDEAPIANWPDVIWQDPQPMTITTRELDPELLALMFGEPVVPLCHHQISAKGTE